MNLQGMTASAANGTRNMFNSGVNFAKSSGAYLGGVAVTCYTTGKNVAVSGFEKGCALCASAWQKACPFFNKVGNSIRTPCGIFALTLTSSAACVYGSFTAKEKNTQRLLTVASLGLAVIAGVAGTQAGLIYIPNSVFA